MARIKAVTKALDGFDDLIRQEATKADDDLIRLVHVDAHIENLKAISPKSGYARIDADTAMSPGTLEAAFFAAGAVRDAVDLVMEGKASNAFCAIRPPGHHATPDEAMGFCFFSNAAIAARHAQNAHGVGRVAVIDFDVHHGNGTEAAFWEDETLFYASTHQFPHYPGTGAGSDRGRHGNIMNVPLPAGCSSGQVFDAYESNIFPAIEAFSPEFIIVSAGFDGHEADPLSHFPLKDGDFAKLTDQILALAAKLCGKRLISTLEGGYNLEALASASAAHVHSLMRA